MKSKLQKHCLFLAVVCWAVCTIVILASCSWTPEQKATEAAFLALLASDYAQTADIADSPEFYEINPILGRDPSIQQVRWYFGGCAVAHIAVGLMLPPEMLKIWKYVWIGAEGATVARNAAIGIGFRY